MNKKRESERENRIEGESKSETANEKGKENQTKKEKTGLNLCVSASVCQHDTKRARQELKRVSKSQTERERERKKA